MSGSLEEREMLWEHKPQASVPRRFRVLPNFHECFYLSSNRSQMTSKCGRDKKVAHEAIAECVTDVLTTF